MRMAAVAGLASVNGRIVLPIFGLLMVAFLGMAIMTLSGAWQVRAQRIDQLGHAAYDLSRALDKELVGVRSLLVGLSTSPALQANDLRTFHQQLVSTPTSTGMFLVLSDREKLLLHTRRPYGTPLVKLSEFVPQPLFLETLDTKGFIVTGRVAGVLQKIVMVTINLAIPGNDGRMRYFLTTAMSDERFHSIILAQRAPAWIASGVYDGAHAGIAQVNDGKMWSAPTLPAALGADLQSRESASLMHGIAKGQNEAGEEILIAYQRSPLTNWTSTASTSAAELNAPLHNALRNLVIAGGILAALGFLLFNRMRQEVGFLEDAVTDVQNDVVELSHHLLRSKEVEQQRIASEIHDSTVQHLARADIILGQLIDKSHKYNNDIIFDVRISINNAINELRTCSYSLMPRNLEVEGLSLALSGFSHGFSQRTGITSSVEVDASAEFLPPELHSALFRIVQEAFVNVHRHAGASVVHVTIRRISGQIVLVVEDNGQAARGKTAEWFEHQAGVGIQSMRGRLTPYGGQLEILPGADGTLIRVTIPDCVG